MSRLNRWFHCVAALAMVLVAWAPAGAAELLIRGATVHTVDTPGTLVAHDVHIRDGRIVAIGQGLSVGSGATVIEAHGRPLTPGLFGGITGLGLEEISLEPSTVDMTVVAAGAQRALDGLLRPEFDPRPAFNPDSPHIATARAEGVTFALVAPSPSPGNELFAGLATMARLHAPRPALSGTQTLMLDLGADASGMGLSRAGQYMLLEQAISEAQAATLAEGEQRLLSSAGRGVLKAQLAGGRIAFAVDRASDIRQAIAFAARFRAKVLIVGGAEAWREAQALAAARIPVLIDPLGNLPQDLDQLGSTLENAARLQAAGVPLVFTRPAEGTHSAHKVRQAAGNAVAHGLAWDAALAALTRNAAEAFGLGGEMGRIAPGMRADLVLWSGDPLEVTTLADQVWMDGVTQPMQTRQSALRDRYLRGDR